MSANNMQAKWLFHSCLHLVKIPKIPFQYVIINVLLQVVKTQQTQWKALVWNVHQDVEDVELDEIPSSTSEQQGFTNMAQTLAQKQKQILKKKIREIQQTWVVHSSCVHNNLNFLEKVLSILKPKHSRDKHWRDFNACGQHIICHNWREVHQAVSRITWWWKQQRSWICELLTTSKWGNTYDCVKWAIVHALHNVLIPLFEY